MSHPDIDGPVPPVVPPWPPTVAADLSGRHERGCLAPCREHVPAARG